MSDINNIHWIARTDDALVEKIGAFIKNKRLEQNKTQSQLAKEAGINRSTLSEFEKGTRSSLITLIQLLRALNQLHVLQQFEEQLQWSPMLLAEMEMKKRKRASKARKTDPTPQSDW